MSKALLYPLLLLNILLLLAGQVAWKQALQQMNPFSLPNVLTSPGIYLGGVLYVAASGVWFLILRHAKLSVAYPMQSLAYVLGIVIAWTLFHETIPPTRWLGAAVILIGIWLVSLD